MKKQVLVGIDRDGTIIKDDGYFGKKDNWKEQIEIYHGFTEGLKLLKRHGLKVIVASNQAGIARRYFNCQRVEEINKEIDRRLKAGGAILDGWYYCPFVGKDYAVEKGISSTSPGVNETNMRKPGIRMLR